MGRFDSTDVTIDGFTGGAEVRLAEDVLHRLGAGEAVSAPEVNRAKDALTSLLWSEGPASAGRGRDGLVALSESSPDPADRGEILGIAVAAGGRGAGLLERLLDGEPPSFLDPEERNRLREVLDQAPDRRLALIADWLGEESPPPDQDPREERSIHGVLPRGTHEETKGRARSQSETGADGDGDGDPPGPRSAQDLLEEALERGVEAIPDLQREVREGDGELAPVALIHLGRSRGTALAAHEAARELEMEPATREVGERIRLAIESSAESGPELEPRPRRDDLETGDRWLHRALELCDAPNLLLAATGREAAVIPLAMRRLAELRRRRARGVAGGTGGGP